MERIIKGVAEFVGVLLVMVGLIVCMCETAEFNKQIPTLLCGIGMATIGAVICFIGNGGFEDASVD